MKAIETESLSLLRLVPSRPRSLARPGEKPAALECETQTLEPAGYSSKRHFRESETDMTSSTCSSGLSRGCQNFYGNWLLSVRKEMKVLDVMRQTAAHAT